MGYTYKQSHSTHRGIKPQDRISADAALDIIDEMQQDEQGLWSDATQVDIKRYHSALRQVQIAFAALEIMEDEDRLNDVMDKTMDLVQEEAKKINKKLKKIEPPYSKHFRWM